MKVIFVSHSCGFAACFSFGAFDVRAQSAKAPDLCQVD